MPLYIRDDDVAALARQVQRMSAAKTITDAVRLALQHEIERLHQALPAEVRLEAALALADAMGTGSGGPPVQRGEAEDKGW